MRITSRLQQLLDTNPDFAKAFHARESWALKHADCVLGLDGAASRRHPDRAMKQDGVTRRNWCGQCPSKEGCVACDLDGHPQVVPAKYVGTWDD